MNPKKYYCVPSSIVLPVVLLFGAVFFVCLIVYSKHTDQLSVPILLMCMLWVVTSLGCAFLVCQQTMCTVQFYSNHAVCRTPFGKNIVITYDKCNIGLDYHVQNGNKIWWIYLCYGKIPPYKNPHLGNRINSIQCQPGFIRIMYREEVYNALIEALPKNQKTALITARRYAGFEKQGRIF